MIIKIDIDDGIDVFDAMRAAHEAISDLYDVGSKTSIVNGLQSQITHVSKAGNIFIHVSKVEG